MFKLTFDTDNAVFEDVGEAEIARILRYLAETIEADPDTLGGTVWDVNGNNIGEWSWTLEE